MTRGRWAAIAAACSAGLFLVYLLTMPPTLSWAHHGADGGDLVTAVVQGRIPHPPGFPTYLLLGALFVRFPWGELAWRLNMMSAVLAAAAAGLAVAATPLLLEARAHSSWGIGGGEYGARNTAGASETHSASRGSGAMAVVAAGLCLGLAPLFWSQALVAEVYAPAAFFAALVAYLALRRVPGWLLGLVWGVGAGAHPNLLLLAPLVAWSVWQGREGRVKRLLAAGLAAFLGWGVMYGPVLLARSRVPSPWGNVTSVAGWWALVSGRLYHGYLLSLPLAEWPRRLLAWAGLLARQFTPLGAVLAAWGALWLWRRARSFAGISLLVFGAFSLYAIGHKSADSLVYLVPALPLAALWLGAGLSQAAAWLDGRSRAAAGLVLLLPVLPLLLFWRQMDVSGDRSALKWADDVLLEAPPQAVLLTSRDAHTFTLWYVHEVLGDRPDVVVVDEDLWGHEPYRRMMVSMLESVETDADLSLQSVVLATGRPLLRVEAGGGEVP